MPLSTTQGEYEQITNWARTEQHVNLEYSKLEIFQLGNPWNWIQPPIVPITLPLSILRTWAAISNILINNPAKMQAFL